MALCSCDRMKSADSSGNSVTVCPAGTQRLLSAPALEVLAEVSQETVLPLQMRACSPPRVSLQPVGTLATTPFQHRAALYLRQGTCIPCFTDQFGWVGNAPVTDVALLSITSTNPGSRHAHAESQLQQASTWESQVRLAAHMLMCDAHT